MKRIARALPGLLLLVIFALAPNVAAPQVDGGTPDPAAWERLRADEARDLMLQNLQGDSLGMGSLLDDAQVGDENPSSLSSPDVPVSPVLEPDWAYSPFPIPTISMRVHAIFLANDDGGRRVQCTPNQVRRWVDEANHVYSSAGIHLDFDPTAGSSDWELMNSTLLNSMTGVEHPDWLAQKALANSVAARTPTNMVVFFRWGPDAVATGAGFSWTDFNFIAAPGFGTGVCGVQNIGLLAHEAGHYLGLPHTFPQVFSSISSAASYFIAGGKNPEVFEADGRDETHPDPYVGTFEVQCNPLFSSLTLADVEFPLPRNNVMSYYYPNREVSSSQFWTVRQGLLLRSGQSLGSIADGGAGGRAQVDEGEAHGPVVSSGGWYHQPMEGFLGRWSGGSQLLWLDAAEGGEMTFRFSVKDRGLYDVYASFTAAPDFGIHTHVINGDATDPVDLYASIVLVTGPVYLGRHRLRAGSNEWKAIATGSNPRARPARHGYGLDYILLVPRSTTFPARVFVKDRHRTIPAGVSELPTCLRVEPVGGSYANSDVDPESIVMDSPDATAVTEVAAVSGRNVLVGDADRNGVAEIPACFASEDMARLFGDWRGRTAAEAIVQGDLISGDSFQGPVELNVVGAAAPSEAGVAPNPMNPEGTLRFATTRPGTVTARVFDLGGRLVQSLMDRAFVPSGQHEVRIDGRDRDGKPLASGIYFYRIESAEENVTGRFVIMK